MDLRPIQAINSLKSEKDRRLMIALAATMESYPARRNPDVMVFVALAVLAVVMASSFFS